jgi:LPXTG-motif cell wall-anchored protein
VSPVPASITSNCSTPVVDPTDANQASCTLTINSEVAGVFTANAGAVVTMGGVSVHRATNAYAGLTGSGPAVKTYVDADIQVAPDGVNPVNSPHTVVGHVNVDPGTGMVDAPDGTVIDFIIDSGPGTLSAPSCTTSGGTGSCSVALNSAVAGVTVVSANSRVTIGNVVLDLATGSGTASRNLTKRWVDAFVHIGPSAINPLNEEHVFTVTVTALPSGAAPVVFDSITTTVAPTPGVLTSSCADPVITGNLAICTVTVNSAVAGDFVANATAQVQIGGAALLRSSDSTVASAGPGGSGPATKTYVRTVEVLGEEITRVPKLPQTGAPLLVELIAGLAVLLVGILVVVGTRRRVAN